MAQTHTRDDEQTESSYPVNTPSIARELQDMTPDEFDRRVRRARQQQTDLADFEDADGRGGQ